MLTGCDDENGPIIEDWVENPDKAETNDWTLVWSDEFNTPTDDNRPDPNKWVFEVNDNGNGNNELQSYTNRVENACLTTEDEEGCLKITARNDNGKYTSARLNTKGRFVAQNGRFVARIKLPYGPGLWPAFWLLGANYDEVGWPACGEIDIMENRGRQPNIVSSAMHCPNHSGGNPFTNTFGYIDRRFDTDFHTFAAEWSKDKVVFSVDRQVYHTVYAYQMTADEWKFDHPFFIILNVAVGGDFDPNVVIDNSVFPQSMYVDYVRVYQKKGQVTAQPPRDTEVSGGVSDWENDDDSNADFE